MILTAYEDPSDQRGRATTGGLRQSISKGRLADCRSRLTPISWKVRFRRAALPGRVIGWALIVVGMLFLSGAIPASLLADFRDRDLAMRLFGLYLPSALALLGGLALKRGMLAVEGSSEGAGSASDDL